MRSVAARESLSLVVAGHVDHGKSTVVGRLLADAGGLPTGKLEQVRSFCERNSRPFEYAFLLDALKEEQSQGITIGASRVFFKTAKRDYLIVDAPGHEEFLKNMVSGASHAEAALLVVDAKEGARENSRRHGYVLSLLGIRQVAVLVNKMDLVGYERTAFERVRSECEAFLQGIGVKAAAFLPVAAAAGENLAGRSPRMPWHAGPSLLELLDSFSAEPPPRGRPFRMLVQDVYKFTARGDDRRIVAGTVEAGEVRPGDEVVFHPSGASSRVRSLEAHGRPGAERLGAGEAAGFTLEKPLFVRRGEIAALKGQAPPKVATRLRASVFWLGRNALAPGRDFTLKLGTARAGARVEKVLRVLDAATLEAPAEASAVGRHQAGEVVLALDRPVAFDLAEAEPATGRFVLVDGFDITGGGLVLEALPDAPAGPRGRVALRNSKWVYGGVPAARREERSRQRACLLIVTGSDDEARKEAARALEERLFEEGRQVYFLGIGSVLYGVDADIRGAPADDEEDMRRAAEVAHILLDAGMVLVFSAARLTQADLAVFRTAVEPSRLRVLWVGEKTTGAACDLEVASGGAGAAVEAALGLLRRDGFIPPADR